jgi:thiol-disulfide isomerase/thioredoxin
MASRPTLTSLKSVDDLLIALDKNPGMIIVKLGATWCAPCQVIESTVKKYFSEMPNNVQCYAIDVDDNFELYGQLRKKKIVKGIPALLAYNDENSDGYPDDFYSGSSIESVEMFFQRCQDWASKL